jgi:hypothetical protein
MPPSAIMGTSSLLRGRAQSAIAVTCGTPTPATMRVVQIEPGPMPTFTASAPASISASRRLGRGDVAGDDLVCGCSRFRLAHGVDDALAVTVRRVDHEHVDACRHERRRALEAIRPDPERRSDAQPALVVLDRVRVLLACKRSLMVMRPTSSPLIAGHEQLLDAVRVQELARTLLRDAERHGDELPCVISCSTG